MDREQWTFAMLLLRWFFWLFLAPALVVGLVRLVQFVVDWRQRGRLSRDFVPQKSGGAERPR